MEDSIEAESPIFIPENNIRSAESSIQAQLQKLKITSGRTLVQTSYFCDMVRDHILNYDDEPQLSKNQNNYRRVYIASELFFNICSFYSHIVDYEYEKIISRMVKWEKFKQHAKKITSKMQLELNREKFFSKEAQGKLLKNLNDVVVERVNDVLPDSPVPPVNGVLLDPSVTEVPPEVTHRDESETEIVQRYERENLPIDNELAPTTGKNQVIDETLAPSDLESLCRDDFPSENITDIREDLETDVHRLEPPISNVSRLELPLPTRQTLDPEISIGEPAAQQKPDDEVDQILKILGDIFPQDVPQIEQPENILEPPNRQPEISGELIPETSINGVGAPANVSEASEEWSLPSIHEVVKTKKRHRNLIIDEVTFIPSYASRAMQLNRNIEIQRVQVYEGPPTLLQAISVSHLMTTPGYKPVAVRSSILSTLYNRHLEVEKRAVEEPIPQRRTVEERSTMDISKARMNGDILEDVRERAAMRSILDKSDVLVEAREKTQLQDLEITTAGAPPRDSLVGVPVSRIINSVIEPPDEAQMERINGAPILPTPRVQQLQGKTLDPNRRPSWFFSTKQNPPKEMYRKFNYVFERLQDRWSLFESQGMEKCITLSEFFFFESEATRADFMTVLRIVDKMSIQRKLVLKYKDGEVFISPFEPPYVSDAQFSLKEKEMIF